MAIPRALGRLMIDVAASSGWRGRVLQLGRQTVYLTKAEVRGKRGLRGRLGLFAEDEAYFRALGFGEVHASDLEGVGEPTHVLDLNRASPSSPFDTFDAVYDGGSVESSFDVANALRVMESMIAPGGRGIHVVTCNGRIDHGYYMLSPGVLHDWYSGRGYEIELAAFASYGRGWARSRMRVSRYDRGAPVKVGPTRSPLLFLLVARRPQQIIERTPYLPLEDTSSARSIRHSPLFRRIAATIRPLIPQSLAAAQARRPD